MFLDPAEEARGGKHPCSLIRKYNNYRTRTMLPDK